MLGTQEDVKIASDSSQEAADESAVSQDAMAGSSPAEKATQQDDKQPETMADAILDQFKKSTADEGSSPEGGAKKESGSESEQDFKKKAKSEDEAKEAGAKKEDGTGEDDKEKAKDEDKGPVPYDRFQEVVHARQAVEQQLTEVKPKVENYDRISTYCEQAGITPDQFNQALEVQALLNSNPQEALKRLMPIVEQLQGMSGERLSPDLQKAVDDGDITLEYAQRLAKAEAQKKYGELSSQAQRQRFEAEQQNSFRTTIANAAQTWEQSKRTADPDYAPKAKDTDPDGKWEMCRHVFTALLHQTDAQGQLVNPIRTAQDMTALMERAYGQVNGTFSRLVQKPVTRRQLSSNGSSKGSKKTIEEAGSMREAIDIALATRES